MKRKELYNYIREEIINELSPVEMKANQLTLQLAKQKLADATKKLATVKDPLEKAQITAVMAVDKEELAAATAALATKTSTNESELEEMARKANTLKVGDQEKFTAAKNLYANSWIGELLNAVEEAGEEGISIKLLTEKVGKKASANINPLIQELKSIGAIDLTRTTEEPEVEEPEAEEPETTTPGSDFFITDKDDEEGDKEKAEEKEPTDSDEDEDNKAYKGAKKVNDKETKKSDEKIIKKNKNKELVDTIIGKIKKLKGDEKVKKIAALKSFINNKDNGFSTSEKDAILKRL